MKQQGVDQAGLDFDAGHQLALTRGRRGVSVALSVSGHADQNQFSGQKG